MKVILNMEQEALRSIVEENLEITKKWQELDPKVISEAFEKMSAAAHQLHMQLDPKPKHHRYMIENRGLNPEHPKFYNHIHPVEDLLKYLDDTTANDDPIDYTLGESFDFKIYTSRWGHYDSYTITRNRDGWFLSHLSYQGQGNTYGETILNEALRHDSVSFPINFGNYMDSIWQRAQDEGLTHEQVQKMLNEVAEWISKTEKLAPRHMLI